MKRLVVLQLIVLSVFVLLVSADDNEDPSLLTIDRLFASSEFRSARLPNTVWLDSGRGYMKTSRDDSGMLQIIFVDPEDDTETIWVPAPMFIPEGEEAQIWPDSMKWSSDEKKLLIFTNTKRVWRANTRGDYWVLDIVSGKLKQLGKIFEESTLMFAKFSPDNSHVAYVMKNNLFVEDLDSGEITQLTFDGSEDVINGTFDWVYEEEFDCRDGFRWSPDGNSIAYWQLDASGVKDFYMINNTKALYPEIIPVQYPKAGETNSAAKIGVVSAKGGDTTWFELEGDPRQHYIARMQWTPDSKAVMFQRLNRHQNRLWLTLGDPETGKTNIIHTEEETAWVEIHDDIHWLDDGEHFTWVSESEGWRQVYTLSTKGELKKITPWSYDVISLLFVDEMNGFLYYIATPEDPTQRYLYRSKLDGSGEPERISPDDEKGWHRYMISKDRRWALHQFSSFASPPASTLVTLPGHKVVKVLEENKELRSRLSVLKSGGHEFFRVTTADNIEVDCYMQKPYDFDPSKKYPVLVYAYTEPWGQTVEDRYTYSMYLWHLMLTQKGYIVLSIDNRGTPTPRGREWRKSIYGKVGRLNSSDQAAGLKAVIEKYSFIDASRIAIWGWSGGGSATLNAMFRYPDLYHTGMAVAPVSNLRFYDTIYQERYTGLVDESPENYDLGSPINFAENLKGNLLIVHGTGDDNVHYQNTEAVINELIKFNKPFTMMAYPNRSHGIYEGENTTRHLYSLLTRYLLENMPPH